MIKKIKIFFIFFAITINLNAQDVYIYCSDVTLNSKQFQSSEKFLKVIESVLSNLERPPKLIERTKLSTLLEFIQDEQNLRVDLRNEKINLIRNENIDFILYSNFQNSNFNDDVYLNIECINVGYKSFSSKFGFPIIPLKSKDLDDLVLFEEKLANELNKFAFTDKLGIVENNILDEINKKIETKSQEINNLRNELRAVTDYYDMAELNVLGEGKFRSGGDLTLNSELNSLMQKILIKEDNLVRFQKTDSTLLILNETILKFPRFPFSYYYKALLLKDVNQKESKNCALKAIEILNYTTKIKSADKNHFEVLKILESWLNKY